MKVTKLKFTNYFTAIFCSLLLLALPLNAKASSEPQPTLATEVVIFEARDAVTNETLLNAAKAMEKTIQSWEGFINRELVDLGNGKWIDIVHWQDMASAQAAQEKAMHSEICLTFFSLIKEENMQMFHGDQKLMQLQKGSLLGHIQ